MSKDILKKASKSVKMYKYKNPRTGEIFLYERPGVYKKDGVILQLVEE